MDFDDMLERGLGRAVLYLQSHEAAPHRETILHACTHFLGYDWQLDSDRAHYYSDIITATGEQDWYIARLTERLISDEDVEMPDQVFAVLALFAAQDAPALREVLYTQFAHCASEQESSLSQAEALLVLDGLPAYVFIAGQWHKHTPSENDDWYERRLLDTAEERFGEEALTTAMAEASAAEPALKGYLTQVREQRRVWQETRNSRPKSPPPTYETLKAFLDAPGRGKNRALLWFGGRDADTDLLSRLAQELLVETDNDRLYKYLYLFYKRPFPLNPQRLIELARHEDEEIARAAQGAAANITNPDVRTLALNLIAEGQLWHSVDMLKSNPSEEDYALLASLTSVPQSRDDFHSLGIEIRQYYKAHPSPEAAPALLNLYENGYCTMCRRSVVKSLQEVHALPPSVVSECRYDADEATRKLVLTRDAKLE